MMLALKYTKKRLLYIVHVVEHSFPSSCKNIRKAANKEKLNLLKNSNSILLKLALDLYQLFALSADNLMEPLVSWSTFPTANWNLKTLKIKKVQKTEELVLHLHQSF